MKTVYSFDIDRNYTGPLKLDDSDLDPLELEEGFRVYLVPGNCLEASPLPIPEGQFAFAAATGEWMYFDIPEPEPEPEPEPVPVPGPTEPVEPEPEPELTLEQRADKLLAFVDFVMESAAISYGYKSGLVGAISYAEEKAVPKYWAEGRMFRRWRSLTYARCYELLAQVMAGEIEEPTPETLIPLLPVLDTVGCAADQAALEAELAAAAPAPAP